MPVFCRGVNVPAYPEHVGMDAEARGDVLQFRVGLLPVSQFQPALSRLEVGRVSGGCNGFRRLTV